MALYFAAHRWGNGIGIYNYQSEANKILRGMRHHPVLTGTSPFRIHPGDALMDLITFDRTWLRPWAFYSVENETVRNELLALFPDGCYAAFAGDV